MAGTIAIWVCFSLLGLVLLNRYLFSWIGLFLSLIPTPRNPILDNKTISVREPNGGTKSLSFVVELHKISAAFYSDPAYEMIYHAGHATVFDGMLTLYRKIGRVWYYIYFDTSTRFEPASKKYKLITEMRVGTGTPLHLWRKGEPSISGERPYLPSFVIKRKINCIIKDLPLTREQKSEIRSNIKIGYETGLKLTLF